MFTTYCFFCLNVKCKTSRNSFGSLLIVNSGKLGEETEFAHVLSVEICCAFPDNALKVTTKFRMVLMKKKNLTKY